MGSRVIGIGRAWGIRLLAAVGTGVLGCLLPLAAAGQAPPLLPAPTPTSLAPHGLPEGGDGPLYEGPADVETLAALVAAGGNEPNFSTLTALKALLGEDESAKELDRLGKEYGDDAVTQWLAVSDFVIRHGCAAYEAGGAALPASSVGGKDLARKLIDDGSDGGTFYMSLLLDHLVGHGVHLETMSAIDERYGVTADGAYHRISNQAFSDMAQALGTKVKLSPFH